MLDDAIRSIVREELRPLREAIASLKQPQQEQLELLTPSEAADVARVSAETVRNWIRRGKLKRHGVNGRMLVRRTDLLKLFQSDPDQVTDDQLEDMALRMVARRR